jgi:periplasmic divalent cation tolerance protein
VRDLPSWLRKSPPNYIYYGKDIFYMYVVIFITASGKPEAKKIARSLLKKKLVACVNMVDKVQSFFWWNKRIDNAKEALLIIKSKKSKLKSIIKVVKSLHSYEAPEIIALPIVGGEAGYLKWIDGALR